MYKFFSLPSVAWPNCAWRCLTMDLVIGPRRPRLPPRRSSCSRPSSCARRSPLESRRSPHGSRLSRLGTWLSQCGELGPPPSSPPPWKGFVLKSSSSSSSLVATNGERSITLKVSCTPYSRGKSNLYALLLTLLRIWKGRSPRGLSLDFLWVENRSLRRWSQTKWWHFHEGLLESCKKRCGSNGGVCARSS